MKRYYAALLLLILPLFSACLEQNMSLCGLDGNCILQFRMDNGSGNVFDTRISSVDVLLFDAADNLIMQRRLNQAELNASDNTATFTVDPGEYRVVCWGNVTTNSQLTPAATMPGCKIETTSTASGCPLYYAPNTVPVVTRGYTRAYPDDHKIIVPAQQRVTKDLNFCRAHRSVNVYVKGFEDLVGGVNIQPTVEIVNLPRQYDFKLTVDPSRTNFTQQVIPVTTPSGNMTMAAFHSPYYNIDNSVDINIYKTSTTALEHTVNLLNYVTTNALTDLDEINILLEFNGGNVDVTIVMPNWNSSNVDPIL